MDLVWHVLTSTVISFMAYKLLLSSKIQTNCQGDTLALASLTN